MSRFFNYLFIIKLVLGLNDVTGQVSCYEQMHVQTDRDIYIAGENLFFKCYAFDHQSKFPVNISKYAYLVLRNERNSLIIGICFNLENHMFSGSIYLPDTLSTGRYQIVSYTNYMRNQGEQSFFTKEIIIANRFDKELDKIYRNFNLEGTHVTITGNSDQFKEKEVISISAERNIYEKRQKIKVQLEGLGLKDYEIANLSVSVHEMLPFSEVSGSPFHLQANHENSNQTCNYLPEINGVILQGKVKDMDHQGIVPNALVFLSAPDTITNLQFCYTDQFGIFKFQLNDYYKDKSLILNLPKLNKATIELDDKFDLKDPFVPSRHFPDSLLKEFILKSQHIVQVQKTYRMDLQKEVPGQSMANVDPPLVYPPIEDPIYPSDFVSLPDFVEISREILPLLKTRKHKESYEARMVDLTNSQFFNSDPMVFLDGVPINSINQIISLGSDKISRIETIGVERYFGNLYFSGILSVFTRKMEINSFPWKTPTLLTKYVILHPNSLFIGSSISKSKREPDFRQLLFWEPSLIVKGKEKKVIEFQASDNKGEYLITLEGITSEGNFVSALSTFKIANSSK